ncbi:AMP-dependent synthetase and ligase [uncultured Sporomusa sp.]|uniref:AMP-dependent synthetase and ligase n=1 Tax=uncultured Sporomusa sp. TaxID=307249 RepID=A0A212LWK7_9FIRM|nr:class I adenylate-forming enzyme family protein [uncultured Sporomusa sp.]SCM81908.1 AMP-dependent synthetase and ligase [uncultured Sporomusa sp.]
MGVNKEIGFAELLAYWGKEKPACEAVYDGFRRMSYQELYTETQQLAAAMMKSDIQKGDRVFALLPNWHEFVVLFFATATIGAILVPCNSLMVEEDYRERLERCKPKAVFVSSQKSVGFLQNYRDNCLIITVRFKEPDCLSYQDLLDVGLNQELMQVELNPKSDTFIIIFTSGSTGIPKGVELTPNNLYYITTQIGQRLQSTGDDVFLVPMPCTHLFGIVTGILVPICVGGKIVLMEKHDARQALRLIEQEKVTVHHGVPTMFIRELQEYKDTQYDIGSLRTGIVAGASCSIVQQITNEFKCDIMVAYGSSETVGISMTSFSDSINSRCGTVGKPYEGVDIMVVDAHGQAVNPGEVGELVCKSQGVMKGYFNMPNQTKAVFDNNGWFYTGDLVTVNEEGYIKIVGRTKEMINRGGYKVYPEEVEHLYHNNPEVLDICVLGFPHAILGEQTIAFIQLVPHSLETEESLRNYAIGKIAKYKIPDKIILKQELPKLESGKTNKKSLFRTVLM